MTARALRTFPQNAAAGLFGELQKYAGQRVDNGAKAKAYAEKFIGRHLQEIAGGKTYSEVSTASRLDPKNQTLVGQKASLFQGETLRGLLLSVWGWSVVATIATIAGIALLLIGLMLMLLPLADWRLNDRRLQRDAAAIKPRLAPTA